MQRRPGKGKNALLGRLGDVEPACDSPGTPEAPPHQRRRFSKLVKGVTSVLRGRRRCASRLRGESSAINSFMYDRAQEVVPGAARMYDVDASVTVVGKADQESPSPGALALYPHVLDVGRRSGRIRDAAAVPEDATAMMKQVKERGGLAAYVQIGMFRAPNASTSTRTCSVSEWKLRPLLRLVRGFLAGLK